MNKEFTTLVTGLGAIKGVSFISIEYRNKQDELAKQLVNVGENYGNNKAKDVKILQELNLSKITDFKGLDHDAIVLLADAKKALIEGFIKPNKAQSEAQKDAYMYFDNINGLKMHKETGKFYIFAMGVTRTVVEKGTYDNRNNVSTWEGAKPLTRAKNFLRNTYCRTAKFKQFSFNTEQLNKMKVNGNTIML